ncbi:hypothetical protein KTF37_26860 [Burkholderia multivorans]|nr:hypothetical protein [Burkholderia multivorans]
MIDAINLELAVTNSRGGDVMCTSAAAQNDMHVNASNTATIICGGDTKIVGATSTQKGERQYRGDPSSRPCRIPAAAHPSSSGGGFSVGQADGSATFSDAERKLRARERAGGTQARRWFWHHRKGQHRPERRSHGEHGDTR